MNNFNAPKWISEKIRVRPYDENKKEDGSYNFIHRVDALTLSHIIENIFKKRITELETELANSVPWEVLKRNCKYEIKLFCWKEFGNSFKCTKQNCPLLNN